MKRVFDKITVILGVIVLLFLCITFLTQCSLMYGNKEFSSDNLSYDAHSILKTCFAGAYFWPEDEEYAVLNIPDTCEGYRVTALGGYVGSGGPSPFMVNLPNTRAVCTDGTLPDNAKIEQYHLVLNIGKHMRKAELIEMDVFHEVGSYQFVQILVTVNCSEKNPFYYSENGKLYRRNDDSLIEGFFYYSDFYS